MTYRVLTIAANTLNADILTQIDASGVIRFHYEADGDVL